MHDEMIQDDRVDDFLLAMMLSRQQQAGAGRSRPDWNNNRTYSTNEKLQVKVVCIIHGVCSGSLSVAPADYWDGANILQWEERASRDTTSQLASYEIQGPGRVARKLQNIKF
jgi:hypothetical protein